MPSVVALLRQDLGLGRQEVSKAIRLYQMPPRLVIHCVVVDDVLVLGGG